MKYLILVLVIISIHCYSEEQKEGWTLISQKTVKNSCGGFTTTTKYKKESKWMKLDEFLTSQKEEIVIIPEPRIIPKGKPIIETLAINQPIRLKD